MLILPGVDCRSGRPSCQVRYQRSPRVAIARVSNRSRIGCQTQRVYLRMAKAKQIVEHHWTEWLAQLYESLRWTVQIAAFVRRADDEDAHIALSSGFNRSPVVLKDVVPVNIHIVEQVAFNGVDNPI